MARCLVLAIALTLSAVTAHAAEPPRMSLAEALSFARDHNPSIREAQARVDAQRAQAGVPRAAWYPTAAALVEAIGATTNNSTATVLSNPMVDLPRIGATPVRNSADWSPSATTVGALGVRQQIYDFGRISTQSAFADTNTNAERAHADLVTRDALYTAAVTYYEVLGARAIVQAAVEAVERARARRDFVVAGIERGLRPQIERDRADADVQRFEVARIRSQGTLQDARADLAAAIGADVLEVDAFEAPAEPTSTDPSITAVIERAEPTDPSLREARLRADAEHKLVDVNAAQNRPNLYVTGALSARAGGATASSGDSTSGNGFIPNVPNWSVGLVFQMPLFDATVRAKVAAARAEEKALLARAEVVRVGIVTEAARAARELAVAREALPALARAKEAAGGNYAQADARFKAGLGTSIELADAEALRVDAEIQYAIGVYTIARARLSVARALSEDLNPRDTP